MEKDLDIIWSAIYDYLSVCYPEIDEEYTKEREIIIKAMTNIEEKLDK